MHLSMDGVIGARHCHGLPVKRSVATASFASPSHLRRRLHQAKQGETRQAQRCRRAVQVSATIAEAPVEVQKVSQDGYEVTQESLSESRRRIIVTAPAKHCLKAWRKMIKQARKTVKTPGFRDMKSVSEATLLPFLGGELGAKAAAVEELIKKLPPEVVSLSADAISESIEPELTDEMVQAFDVAKPFTYQLVFDIQPTLRWKQPYQGMKVEVTAVGDDESDRAKVAQEIMQVRKKKGGLKVVQGRGLQLGDAALIDFDAKRSDTGEEFAGAKRRKTHMDTDSADMQFLPGVGEKMIGMKVGESRQIQLTLPDNFEPAPLRGVDVTCTVSVTELFEYDLPELDDDLAEEVAPGSRGVQGLQTQLLRMQNAKTAQDNEEAVDEALMETVVHLAQCDVPYSMVKEMGQQEYQARLHTAQAKREITYEQVMQLATAESLENWTQKNLEMLQGLIKRQMAFEHIFAAEGLTLSDAEIQQEYDEAARDFIEQKQEFDADRLREQATEMLKAPKIIKWLRDNCEITMLPARA
ncbi:hypothetical protein WJX82_002734 [Trebouxia sp. C0006]